MCLTEKVENSRTFPEGLKFNTLKKILWKVKETVLNIAQQVVLLSLRQQRVSLDSVQRAVSRMINPDNHDLICQKHLVRILHFVVLTTTCVSEAEMIFISNMIAHLIPLFY